MVLGPGMPLKKALGKSAEVIGQSESNFLKLVSEAVGLTVLLEFVGAINTAVGHRVGQPLNLGGKVDIVERTDGNLSRILPNILGSKVKISVVDRISSALLKNNKLSAKLLSPASSGVKPSTS